MKIDITNTIISDLIKISEQFPNGRVKAIGNQIFWVFDDILK